MYYSPKTSTDGLVFHYDTGNTVRSYLGEPTTNLLPNGVAAVHDAASGNAVTVTDATTEKGPGWKKVTITARGSNFRTLQWTYLSMSANTSYIFSAQFDWGNMRGKNYYIFFDGDGSGGRTYYRPGDYSNAGSELINSTMPDGKFAGRIYHTATHTHSFFIGNSTTGVSGLNDYFYYKEFQAEINSHPTQFTTGTRSATQGLKDLTARNTIDIGTVSFNSNAQITFDGTDDYAITSNFPALSNWSTEVWLNPSVYTSAQKILLDVNLGIRFEIANGYFNSHFGNGSGWIYTNLPSTTQIAANKWFHVTVTVQSGGQAKVYVNGTLENTVSIGSGTTPNIPLYIGRFTGTTGYEFNGQIPVVKIYNRALSADEVQRNFNAVKSRFNIA
jgi:hypothetical protein